MRGRPILVSALTAVVATMGPLTGCASTSTPVVAAVRIGPAPIEFQVEVAQTAEQQRDGLSGRDELSAGTGMLFRFGSSNEHQVWMADMKFPLDIAWIGAGKVVAIDTLSPCTESDQNACPRWTSPSAVDALLEVPAHSLTTVTPGMTVTVEEKK